MLMTFTDSSRLNWDTSKLDLNFLDDFLRLGKTFPGLFKNFKTYQYVLKIFCNSLRLADLTETALLSN